MAEADCEVRQSHALHASDGGFAKSAHGGVRMTLVRAFCLHVHVCECARQPACGIRHSVESTVSSWGGGGGGQPAASHLVLALGIVSCSDGLGPRSHMTIACDTYSRRALYHRVAKHVYEPGGVARSSEE